MSLSWIFFLLHIPKCHRQSIHSLFGAVNEREKERQKDIVKKYDHSKTKTVRKSDNSQNSSVIQQKTRIICIKQAHKKIINAKSKIKNESNERTQHIVHQYRFRYSKCIRFSSKVRCTMCERVVFSPRKSVDGTLQSNAMN